MPRTISPLQFLLLRFLPLLLFIGAARAAAQNPAPPTLRLQKTNSTSILKWSPYPATDLYRILRTPSLDLPFQADLSGTVSTNTFFSTTASSNGFFRLEITPMPTNRLQASTALNHLAYGPTPDDIEYWSTNSIDALIEQQLAPENIGEIEDTELTFTNTVGANTFRWVYVQQTGTYSASANNGLYIYLSGAGIAYVDDLRLVAGTNLAGPNLITNGDFELPLSNPPYALATNCDSSAVSSEASRSGASSLKLVFTSQVGNPSAGNAINITNLTGLSAGQACTISYWYVPSTNRALTIRFSNSGINTSPDSGNLPSTINRRLQDGTASLSDLRRWYSRRAVRANRQLLEVLTQFWDNHFVTQHSKSVEYFDRYYDDSTLMGVLAAELEYREIGKWRARIMDPNATFYDMLRISAESPAMIMYLDTARSKGNGGNIANENYARELLELFTFGVDNGYDQNDITVMSRAWTGWTINLVDPAQAGNPFLTNYVFDGSSTYVTNLPGIWTFSYMPSNHNNLVKTIFPSKTVPARFGSPWAGNSYQLILPVRTSPNGGVNGGTNGIADGYDVIAHLANQPFAMEFISVKLCRWFVHEDFEHGVYDYTDPNMSPEARLVHECMLAWHNATPRGNMRTVLRTIFNSDLFRTHAGAGQKVKTPLEFAAGTIRALRSFDANGLPTADTDGNFATALSRMGSMLLFDRAEPNGYPESGSAWVSAGTLVERLRFAQSVLMSSNLTQSIDPGSGFMSDPVRLLKKKLPSNQWDNTSNVADLFLFYIYPGEGRANLEAYKAIAVNFLNTADDGVTSSAFSGLGNTSGNYDTRVRGMVAMLMTLPRFQEQ